MNVPYTVINIYQSINEQQITSFADRKQALTLYNVKMH